MLNLWRKIERSLIKFINLDRHLPIQLDITNACNLRCVHCYHPHHSNAGALTFSQWTQILEQYDALIRRLGYKPLVILCGGEPLISAHMQPILSYIAEKNPHYNVIILSNGLKAKQFAPPKALDRHRITFQISLDGPNPQSHDAIRGPGSFKAAREGVDFLLRSGYAVDLQAVLSKRVMASIPDFFNTAKDWGVRSMKFARLIGEGQAKQLIDSRKDEPLSALELKHAYSTIIECSRSTGVLTSTDRPLMHLLDSNLGGSSRAFESIVIDYQGRYLASSRSRLPLGNVLEEGLENIFLEHPLLKKLRAGDVEVCGSCRYFRRCGGDRTAAFAGSGNFLGRDPGCWYSK